ncbi:lamin tail domain-containing protein [Micromonospora thermarum]|nr:lamin tail domain-containing protein [Micromonospora thermarum]
MTAGLLVLSPGTADAASPNIVISQVYGGGGNSGAQYRNDYIELYNRGTATVSLAGWSVQYASSTGSSWSKTNLSGSIDPGEYFLIQHGSGGNSGAALPTPDATGSVNLSATKGKVALKTDQTVLTCSTGCTTQSGVRDFLGYGSGTNSYEGAGPAPTLSNTTAALRAGAGATDTDDNASDFTAAAPTPRNSSYGGGDGCSGTCIRTIQAAKHISPLNGQSVSGVPGIVTAKSTTGFWFQDPNPDNDPATSEGMFVYTGGAPQVNVGHSVTVSGTVSEYRRGGSSTDNLTITEIVNPSITTISTGNPLPAPIVVGSDGRVPPSSVIDNLSTGDVETRTSFDPTTQGIDFWESLEGMRVRLDNPKVVGPRNTYGEIPIVPVGSGTMTTRGGIAIQSNDFNPERVLVDDLLVATPTANVGDTLSGAVVGLLDYSFGNYKLQVTGTPTVSSGGITPETTATPSATELAVATFNVENLAPGDPQSKFDTLASQIKNNLKSPDLIAVEEVQDNSGTTDNGVVAADQTWTKLINAITAAGGPTYQYRQIDPVDGQDGGAPGGNIRQGFLFRTDRGLSFVDRPAAGSTTANSVINNNGAPQLRYSPGRIDPANSAFNASRKPLAGEFTWNGQTFFAIANHFNSKGGDDPLFGRWQPPVRSSETQRHQQAAVVNGFVDQILAVQASAKVIVLGDINDFEFSETTNILTGNGSILTSLPATLPAAERYTYVYEGNSQVLDQILLSSSLTGLPYAYDMVHVNSEFAAQVSDHDPQVVRLPF